MKCRCYFLGIVIENAQKPKVLRDFYTPVQQQILIYILLTEKPTIVAKEVSSKLNIPIATVYRGLKYFSDIGYIQSNHGEYIYLKSRINIYDDSINYFISPIEDALIVTEELLKQINTNEVNIFISGIDALSAYSMLASNKNEYGMSKDVISKLYKENYFDNSLVLSSKKSNLFFNKYNKGDVQLDVWKYDPTLMNEGLVDPISLSLVVKNEEEDSRIEETIEQLNRYIHNILDELEKK